MSCFPDIEYYRINVYLGHLIPRHSSRPVKCIQHVVVTCDAS